MLVELLKEAIQTGVKASYDVLFDGWFSFPVTILKVLDPTGSMPIPAQAAPIIREHTGETPTANVTRAGQQRRSG